MITYCADCNAEMDHCHGTLVAHDEGGLECTDDGCTVLDTARHDVIIDCTSIDGECNCGAVGLAPYSFRPCA